MTVALGFERRALARPLEGFGFLVPRRERRRVVACTFVGTKFNHRVPDDLALLRCFLGGDGALAESDDVVIETVLDELRDLAGIAARPLFTRIFRWPRSMAQYTVGHQRRLSEIESRLAELPGVHLAGNAYYGIGIPDCVRLAKEVAGRIAAAP